LPFFSIERFSRVTRLALPAALGAMADSLQVMIDFILVGYLEVSATAAIGIALQFTGLFYTLMGIFYIGSNALMSRFMGAGETQEANRVFSTFALITLAISLPIMTLSALFSAVPFWIMDTDARVSELGAAYLFALAFGVPAMMINQIAFSAFSAAADIKTPLFIKIFSNIINIALSFILIFGAFGIPAFGVAGAAAGTAISFYLETICYGYLILIRKRPVTARLIVDRDLFARGLKVGIPAGVERLLWFGSFLLFMRIISDFGTQVMAGYQIGLRVESIAFMPGIGFTIAAMSLTGRALGAKKPAEAEKDALFTAFIAAALTGVCGAFIALFALPLSSIFSNDKAAIEAAKFYVICVGLSQIPLNVSFVLSGAFRGAGDSRTSLKINLASMWLFRLLPSIAAAWFFDEILLIWLIMILETWIRGAWLFVVFKRGRWKLIKV
jgi:putative MATE family efflux protein